MVLPGVPYYATRRENRRERTVFKEGEYVLYLDLWTEAEERV